MHLPVSSSNPRPYACWKSRADQLRILEVVEVRLASLRFLLFSRRACEVSQGRIQSIKGVRQSEAPEQVGELGLFGDVLSACAGS